RNVDVERYVDVLLELLEQFDTEYVRNPEPKIQLINALEEFPRDDVRLALEPFLMDVNEGVRFAAVGATFATGTDAAVGSLLEALEQEESLRVRNRIASGLAERAWDVPNDKLELAKRVLPEGYRLEGNRLVRS